MLSSPRTFTPIIICAVVTAAAVVTEAYSSGWVTMFAMLASWIFLGATLFYFIDYILDLFTTNIVRIRQSEVLSYEAHLAEKLAALTKDQLEVYIALLTENPDIERSSDGGYIVNGIRVPESFVQDLLRSTKGGYLKPERDFSEGSKDRLYYKAVVGYLVDRGVADPARGNKAAKVRSWREALTALEDT